MYLYNNHTTIQTYRSMFVCLYIKYKCISVWLYECLDVRLYKSVYVCEYKWIYV